MNNVSIIVDKERTPKKKLFATMSFGEYADSLIPQMNLITSAITEAFKSGIKPNEFAVFCLIESYNQNEVQVPSPVILAENLRMTERNFHNIVKDMTERGFLELKGKKTKRVYDFSKLKALMHIK